jgi:uracil phosphoribosyltransferase
LFLSFEIILSSILINISFPSEVSHNSNFSSYLCLLLTCLRANKEENEKKYILPGLGDAGDLWTGTN